MKRILLLIALCVSAGVASAQMIGLETEVYSVHDVDNPGIAELAGMTTYRLYATFTNEDDFLSAVYAVPGEPLEVRTSTTFFQSSFAGNLGENVNTALFAAFPATEYDSFVTIGRATGDDPGSSVSTIEAATEQWVQPFADGGDIVINGLFGGSWFHTFSETAVNGYAGPDLKVLIGQFTTDGLLQGVINCQVFVNGVQADDENFAGFSFSSDSEAVFGCTDEDATNYDATATIDDLSCVFPCAVVIDEIQTVMTTCPGGFDGAATIIASGGQGSVSYTLDDGSPLANNGFSSLGAGSHNILVSDDQGCTAEMEFDVPAPEDIVVTATLASPITCAGDADAVITLEASGGTGELMFDTTSDFTNPTSATEYTDLDAGTYNYFAVDANGCEAAAIPLSVTAPLALQGNIQSTTAADCNGGEGILQGFAFGGSVPYQYSVDGGETWSNNNLLDLVAGEYMLMVQDANGCLDDAPAPGTITEPEAITITPTTLDVLCAEDGNGSITVAADGGNGGFTYSFDGGLFSDTTSWMDLSGGMYMVDVMDSNDCMQSLEIEISEPEALAGTLSATDISCNGDGNGSVTFNVTGGTQEYSYSLNGGDSSSDSVFADLEADTYGVVVTDANGCTFDGGTVDVAEPTVIMITNTVATEETAADANDGSIDVDAAGGTGDLTYSWTGPDGFTADTEDIDGLAAGAYNVTITDENGCDLVVDNITVVVGVSELANNITVSVYPNPNNGQFNLNFDGLAGETVGLRVADAQGRLVIDQQFNNLSGSYTHPVDLQGAANGMYYLTFTANGFSTTQKIVKQ